MRMRNTALAGCVAGFMIASADANGVRWDGNGHYYELITTGGSGFTWDQARDAAAARGGYLATLTSAEENAFVAASIMAFAPVEHYWIGARQAPTGVEPTGGWGWITGEPWSFTNWAPGEPNNAYGNNPNQDALGIFGNQHYTGEWNDIWNELVDPSMGGYLVEYDSAPPCALKPGTLLVSTYLSGGLHLFTGPEDPNPGACITTFSPVPKAYYACFGPDGFLYVSGADAHRIYRVDGCSGEVLGDAVPPGLGGLSGVKGIAFGPDGRLYACSSDTDQVLWFDLGTGDYGVFADFNDCGLDHANDIAFRDDGFAYVAEGSNRTGRILKISLADGSCSVFATGSSPDVGIEGITFGPDDDLYAAAQFGADSSVRRFDGTTGQHEGDIPAMPNCIRAVRGRPVFDAAGRMYVCSSHTNQVMRIDRYTGACEVYASGCGMNTPFSCMFVPPDSDGDGVPDPADPCPNDPNNDEDGDGICGDVDNCPTVYNPDQTDIDGDGIGDACDACPSDPNNDEDGDGICGDVDNCPTVYNPDQADCDGDGIGDACDPNSLPEVNCGSDCATSGCEATSSAGRLVLLNSNGTYDPDGDPLTFHWDVSDLSVVLDDPSSPTPSGVFPIGITMATLTVADGCGDPMTCDVLVTVSDSTPPEVMCTSDLASLWPPNHTMRTVRLMIVARDAATDPGDFELLSVTLRSNEPDDAPGLGDGDTSGDVDGADGYSAPVDRTAQFTFDPLAGENGAWIATVQLRAERDGAGDGRCYTIDASVRDHQGNLRPTSCCIVVPHDRRR